MFTVTSNSDATILTFYHPELTNVSTGIILKMSVGCSSTQQTFTISNTDVTNNSFTLTSSALLGTGINKIPDGIYYFVFQFDYTDTPDIVNKDSTFCLFIDYDTKCKYSTLSDTQKMIYKSLKYGNTCDTCTCTKLCELFSLLTITTTTTNAEPCGCD